MTAPTQRDRDEAYQAVLGMLNGTSSSVAEAIARARHAGEVAGAEKERFRVAEWVEARAAKLREDAKTIPFGARSVRRTFLKYCPAYDTERYVAVLIDEVAAAIRSLAPAEKEPGA